MRLTLVAGSELPGHLLSDTEHTLRHVGWLGVRRRVVAFPPLHVLHFDGVVPPVTLTHAGHDHERMLADLRTGWITLGVCCALDEDAPDVPGQIDPALAAVALLRASPSEEDVDDLPAALTSRATLLLRRHDAPLPPGLTQVAAALGLPPGVTTRHAVTRAARLLGLTLLPGAEHD